MAPTSHYTETYSVWHTAQRIPRGRWSFHQDPHDGGILNPEEGSPLPSRTRYHCLFLRRAPRTACQWALLAVSRNHCSVHPDQPGSCSRNPKAGRRTGQIPLRDR